MAQKKHMTEPDHSITGYPPGVPYIVGNEACERFSYYGMKAILYVFLWKYYVKNGIIPDASTAQSEATAIVHFFNTGVYALPMIGAIIADRLTGKYHTILWLSIVYCLGHAFLAIFENNLQGFYMGLGLIAVGSGGIKPCVSAHVGDQFGKGNSHLLQRIYQWFYFSINFGSTFATLLIPLILKYWGPGWAFGIPGILMGLATFAFWMGRHTFVHIQPSPGGKLGLLDALSGSFMFLTIGSLFFTASMSSGIKIGVAAACMITGLAIFYYRQSIEEDDGFLATTLMAIKHKLEGDNDGDKSAPEYGNHWLYGSMAKKFGDERAEGPIAVWKIISIFFLVSVFWALFDQHSSTWIRQAESMDLVVNIPGFLQGILGTQVTLLPSQIPSSNPIMVMALIPFCAYFLYPWLTKNFMTMTPLRIMTIGIFVTSSSFFAVWLIQMQLDAGNQLSVLWQLIPFLLLTLGEVMVSITGLEFAYTQAPKRMKSTVMGFWLLTVSLGNVITGLLAKFGGLPLADFFLLFAVLCAVAGAGFGLRAKFYQTKEFIH